MDSSLVRGVAALDAPVEPTSARLGCDCITTTNAMLEEKHNALLVTTMFGKPPRCTVGTAIYKPKRGARPPIMLATFCPFCGVKYQPTTG